MDEIKKGIAKKIQNIRDSVSQELNNLEKDLENYSKLLNICGKPLLPYRDDALQSYETFWHNDEAKRAFTPHGMGKKTEEESKNFVKEIWTKCEKIHAENLKVIEHNISVIKVVSDFLVSIGLSLQRRMETKHGRKSFSDYVDSYWLQELKNLFPISDNSYHDVVTWKDISLRTIESFWNDKRRKEAEIKKKVEQAQLFNEAVEFLIKNGKKMGADYQADTAIDAANEFAVEKLIKEYKEKGDYIPFGGDGSCENCKGWKPGEHRCDCGNRRVYFETDSESTFKDPRVYAQAD